MSHTFRSILFSSLAVGALLITPAVPASAAPTRPGDDPVTPLACDAGPPDANGYWYYPTYTNKHIPSTEAGARVDGDPGITLSIQVNKTYAVNASLQTTASVDAGVVFAKVGGSVAATVGASSSVSTANGGAWTVPAGGQRGWLEIGSSGYQISWEKGTWQSPCTWVPAGSGTTEGATGNTSFANGLY